jgi:hypothetical protein
MIDLLNEATIMTTPIYTVRDIFDDPMIIDEIPNLGFVMLEGTRENSDDKFHKIVLFEYYGTKNFDGIQNREELHTIRNNKLIGVLDLTKELMVNQDGPFVKVINNFGYMLLNLGVKIL